MDPAGLIPTPDSIPVPWGWFRALLLLTFVLHLILMNLMLGGGLVGLWRRWRGGASAVEGRSLPTLIALTVNLGVPPLLFVQVLFGQFLYSSSILMAAWWISVIPLLILAYYAAYGSAGAVKRSGRASTVWLGISTFLLLVVGFLYTNNMTLMVRPERWTAYFQGGGGGFLNLSEPTLFPRFLHFVVAAVAIFGLGSALYHQIAGRRAGSARPEEIRDGLRLFAFASMAQVVVGVLFWLTLPAPIRNLFAGGSGVHTGHLWGGALLGLAAIGTALRRQLGLTVALALVTVVTMVLVRDLVRDAYLAPHFRPADLPVATQWSPFVAFVGSLLVVVAILVWMARSAWAVGREVKP